MSNRFFSLFRPGNSEKDSLRQEQREAILDSLHFCMYADNHLAFAEDKVIDDWAVKLSWDAQLSVQEYESRSIALARRAKDDAKYRGEFLASIGKRLDDSAAKILTLSLCKKLLSADGAVSDSEDSVLSELKKVIGGR